MKVSKRSVVVELKIFIILLIVAVINAQLFAALTPSQQNPIIFFANVQVSFVVYLLYILGSTFAILSKNEKFLEKIFSFLLGFVTFQIIINLYLLIVNHHISDNGKAILSDALLIWVVSLVVFSLWYWLIDKGGPLARYNESDSPYDLLFPQYQTDIPGWKNWKPKVLDYFFFSFFTSTGFSPADTLPLSKRVKFLMMIEAFISLIIIGMVVSRAISLLN